MQFNKDKNRDNYFLIELVRKRQKEEILSVIREEEKIERERLITLKNANE